MLYHIIYISLYTHLIFYKTPPTMISKADIGACVLAQCDRFTRIPCAD